MRRVPAHFVDLAFADLESSLREEFLKCGVLLEGVSMIDLSRIEDVSSFHAKILKDYAVETINFWDRYVASGVGGACVVTERTARVFTKVDKKGSKVFLKEQVAALEEINGVGEALGELLGGLYNPEKLNHLDIVHSIKGNLVEVRFEVFGKEVWAEALGGPPERGEVARIFELKISHAASHDRKSQRLLEVRVKPKEVWPSAIA